MSAFIEKLVESSVTTNLTACFILALLEKIMEMEFACPCDPKWNAWVTAGFFGVPAILVFLLVLLIHVKREESSLKTLSSILPAYLWVDFLFLNGEYFVCGNTDWPGKYVSVDKSYLKWCSPTNTTRYSELLNQSHDFYILSQNIGIVMLIIFVALVLVLVIKAYKQCG